MNSISIEEIKEVLKRIEEDISPLPASYIYLIKDIIQYSNKKDPVLIFIIIALFISLNNGSTSLRADNYLVDLLKKMGLQDAETQIKTFFDNIKEYDEIISTDEKDYKPIIAIPTNKRLYFHKYYGSEKTIQSIITKILTDNKKNKTIGLEEALKTVENIANTEIKPDQFQKIAIILSLTENFLIISGGPGTGKTTIIKYILQALIKSNFARPAEIALAAPTGKAAQRISDMLKTKEELNGITASTIHRLLGYSFISNDFRYGENNQLPFKVLIIDEISMIDIKLLENLFKAVQVGTKIILIGDKDQLPSVEAGAFINKLIPENFVNRFSPSFEGVVDKKYISEDNFNNNIVLLEISHRSEKNLQQLAYYVNAGQSEKVMEQLITIKSDEIPDVIKKEWEYGYTCHIELKNNNIFNNILIRWFDSIFSNSFFKLLKQLKDLNSNNVDIFPALNNLFEIIEKGKVLSFIKDGTFGIHNINRIMYAILKTRLNRYDLRIESGIPIMITKNDYNLKLFNGNIGILVRFEDKQYAIFKIGENNYRKYEPKILPPYQKAFSISVHKSQGSEYNHILMFVSSAIRRSFLNRQILYTGITRAKKGVIIVGDEDGIRKSVRYKIERDSGLNLYEIIEKNTK